MLFRAMLIAALHGLTLSEAASGQLRVGQATARLLAAPGQPSELSPEVMVVFSPEGQALSHSLGTTLLGSVAGAAATLAYFAVRDEDTYECNACLERALVAGLASMTSTAVGASLAGAGTMRSALASFAGSVVGASIGLVLIEPLSAGWPAGMVGFTLSQGLVAGLIAHGGLD